MGAGDCGTMRTRHVLPSKYYQESTVAMTRDGQSCMIEEKEGLSTHSGEKEGIIDESAAYSFLSQNKQVVKLHCTASGDEVEPRRRQKHPHICPCTGAFC